jgi:hypothetical protein
VSAEDNAVNLNLQFPGSKEEKGLQREPEGAKQAREEGRTPAVDTPEEAAAPAHEYEFQAQVGNISRVLAMECWAAAGQHVAGLLAMVWWGSGSRSCGMHCWA